MTTFKSIAGGALWSLIAAGLLFTALEPVSFPEPRDPPAATL